MVDTPAEAFERADVGEGPGFATAELDLGGMHCSACATRIQRSLNKLPGVASNSMNLATHRSFVSYDPDRVSYDPDRAGGDDLVAAVTGVGYSAAQVAADAPAEVASDPDHWMLRLAISWPLALAALAVALLAPRRRRPAGPSYFLLWP
jgi:cation transport ATPase